MTILIFAASSSCLPSSTAAVGDEVPPPIHGSLRLEIAWSVIPFLVMLTFFWWGAKIYFDERQPAARRHGCLRGRQTMDVEGPISRRTARDQRTARARWPPVKVTLASEDVIHSFFIPALPPQARRGARAITTPCGSPPLSRAVIICSAPSIAVPSTPAWSAGSPSWSRPDYENWLSGGGAEGTMAAARREDVSAAGLHHLPSAGRQGRCPILRGVYGSRVLLQDGRTVMADDSYIRESILNPNAKIVAGYKSDIMPTFQGQISEEGILQLIVYIKSLGDRQRCRQRPAASRAAGNSRRQRPGTSSQACHPARMVVNNEH